MTSETSVKDRGRDIMLPPQGDPFRKDLEHDEIRIPDPDRLDDIVMESAADEPRDLGPEELAAMFPSTADERNVLPEGAVVALKGRGPMPPPYEPTSPDLSPADLAAMYPGSADERNMLPAGDEAPVTDPEVLAILDEMKAAAAADEAMPAAGGDPPFEPIDPFAEETRAAGAIPLRDHGAGGGIAAAAGIRPTPTALPEAPAPIEIAPPGVGSGRLSDHNDDLLTTDRIMEVEETDEMLAMLVTDAQITGLWHKIEKLENSIIENQAISSSDMELNIKRLKIARNNLLGGRKYYEDAERLVAEVEFDSRFSQRVRVWSYSWGTAILAYLLTWLVAIGYAGIQVGRGNIGSLVPPMPGLDPNIFLTALIAGVLGGVTGAMRSLWVHVAQEQDFDPQHRMWYFVNPIMGLVLAILIYWIFFAGILNAVADEPSGTGIFVLYVLAWLSGFQQNVALHLVKRAMNFILGSSKSGD